MTVKSKKRRLARRRAHAKGIDHRSYGGTASRGRFSVRSPDTEALKESLLKHTFKPTPETTYTTDEIPSRAECPTCGFRQKVRKDGTMGRHDIFLGSEPRTCEGSGKPWNVDTQ